MIQSVNGVKLFWPEVILLSGVGCARLVRKNGAISVKGKRAWHITGRIAETARPVHSAVAH